MVIYQKTRKKDVYENDMQKIYNIIVGHKKNHLQEKVSSDATLQAANTGQDPIGYMMVLNKLCFSNQSEKHLIQSLCLSTRRLYNTIQNVNNKTTGYLVSLNNEQKAKEAYTGSLI